MAIASSSVGLLSGSLAVSPFVGAGVVEKRHVIGLVASSELCDGGLSKS